MISLRCIPYIVSFNDMFRLKLWAIVRLITFLSKVKYTISNAIVIVAYEISYNILKLQGITIMECGVGTIHYSI
jgi:hypothetical protein